MDWIELTKQHEPIWRGAVFRIFPTTDYPYERPVDFMLIENGNSESGLAVMVATGYKAGITFIHLPKESLISDGSRAISPAWLVQNWCSHVYSDCVISEVLVIDGYPSGIPLTNCSEENKRAIGSD